MGIQVLSPDVVDRIAAGEVLDRPANLIKELVENSLDAGATRVDVEFGDGGRSVVVRDNGSGIEREDLTLALQRHATSKISDSDDLFKLHSFGFRGEALASIAAVSDLTLTSRRRGTDTAYRVRSRFGSADAVTAVSASEGTEVRVTGLFENVPARLKFLKSESGEHGQIKTTLKALALANEKVAFNVRLKEELLYHWPADQTFAERVCAVLGKDEMFEGSYEGEGVKARVMVTAPQDTMNVNRGSWFFVQGRWIQDRSLNAAVMEGYRNLLMHGEYPTVVVRLELSPENVDVNVHPTKSQVKFADPSKAFRATHRAIREILEKAPWLKGAPPPESATASFFQMTEPEQENLSFQAAEFSTTNYAKKSIAWKTDVVTDSAVDVVAAPATATATDTVAANSSSATTSASATVSASAFKWSSLHVVGQLNLTYFVAQNSDAMYLIDQHAAHERVVFERLMHSFRLGRMDVQNLLIPLIFDFTADEVEALIKDRERIEKMGLNIERMGPESLAVQSIPALISENAVSGALKKLAFELVRDSGSSAFELAIGDIFATMACHSVVRAGQSQSPEQMTSLLAQMDEFPLSSFCPHGRPVYVKRRFADLEREFGRIN